VRHANLPIILPTLTLLAFFGVGYLLVGVKAKVDTLVAKPDQEHLIMEPDSTTLESSWCYKMDREPPQAPLHTTVTVKTSRNPGETPAQQLERHLQRVATQQETTPDNCTDH